MDTAAREAELTLRDVRSGHAEGEREAGLEDRGLLLERHGLDGIDGGHVVQRQQFGQRLVARGDRDAVEQRVVRKALVVRDARPCARQPRTGDARRQASPRSCPPPPVHS
jgi:hypothetical protein